LIAEVYAEYDCTLVLDEEPHLKGPAEYFRASGGEFWVVEVEGEVRATAAVALRADGAELKTLYVHSSLRKQGWGRRLVGLALEHARKAGRRSFYLWSDTRFLDAHRLYRQLGFREGGLRDLNDSNRSVEQRFDLDFPIA
jgi:putative acetyltransferase